MGMREDTRTTRYFRAIDPGAACAGVAEKVRSLSAVGVVGRRKPPDLVRSQPDNFLLVRAGQACCPCGCRNDGDRGTGYRKDSLHLFLLSKTVLAALSVTWRMPMSRDFCETWGSDVGARCRNSIFQSPPNAKFSRHIPPCHGLLKSSRAQPSKTLLRTP